MIVVGVCVKCKKFLEFCYSKKDLVGPCLDDKGSSFESFLYGLRVSPCDDGFRFF
jgi:hypothetical protein